MKLRLLILLAAALAASPAAGQTVKSLGFNTTNGQVVYSGTNTLTFTNPVGFSTNARAATRTNLGATTVGNSVFTATNAAAARSAIGAGTVNEGGEPSFESVTANLFTAESINEATGGLRALDLLNFSLTFGATYVLEWSATDVQLNKPLTFFGTNTASTTRTNLGLGAFKNPDNYAELLNASGQTVLDVEDSVAVYRAIDWVGTNSETYKGDTRTNLGLGATNTVTFSNITASGTLAVSNAATFATNVTVNGNISVGSLTTTTPSTWALDATQTAAATNGILALPSNANVIRLTNNNAISGVSGGVLGAFYYLVNQTTNAVTISNVGGITVQGGTPLTLGANQAATLVATGATNASVAARGDLNDVTLGGTANTAPSQTASSGSSLMTRGLSDDRYFGFSQLFYEKQDFATAGIGTTNGGALNASRGNVRFTMQTTNGSGAMWIASVKRGVFATQGASTSKEGYGVYALTPVLTPNSDILFGVFYGSALPNGVSSFEPLSTNGYSVQWRNNGTNQLRYVYKNGTNDVSGPWTSLPSAPSSSVEIAAINTTNGFRVLYRRPGGAGTPDWTTLTNVEVAWTNSTYVGSAFGGIGVIRTNTHTNVTVYDPYEWGYIIGGENL